MRTLFLVGVSGDRYTFWFACPFCKKLVDTDPTSASELPLLNCVIWCDCCKEIIICPTSLRSPTMMIGHLIKGSSDGCTVRLTRGQALHYVAESDLVGVEQIVLESEPDDKDGPTIRYLGVGVLVVSKISTKTSPTPREVNVTRIGTVPLEILSLDHGESNICYESNCTECGKKYQSWLWDDHDLAG
jgi:hypothetical protein